MFLQVPISLDSPANPEPCPVPETDPNRRDKSSKGDRSTKSDVSSNLEMFQQQRLLHTKRLKKEIIKLEKMEHALASESSARMEKSEKVFYFPHRDFCFDLSNGANCSYLSRSSLKGVFLKVFCSTSLA